MAQQTILVTGAEGRIGGEIIPRLAALGRYTIRSGHAAAFDEPGRLLNPVVCQLEDERSVLDAVAGVDAVIHLAGDGGDRPFVPQLVPDNIVGPYHVCRAAAEHGVRRVVFASTNHVMGNWWSLDHQAVTEEMLPRPDSLYGVTKAYGEVLGRFFVERRRLPSFIAVRIGNFGREDEPHVHTVDGLYQWISPRDMAQLFARCLDAPASVGFAIVAGISDNDRQLMLLDHTKELLGYAPEDNAERFAAELAGDIPDWLVRRTSTPRPAPEPERQAWRERPDR